MARYPTRFQLRTLWNAATGVSILILGALIVGLIWLIGKIFGFLQPVLVPLAVAAITAYLLDPVVRLFQKRGFSRKWSVVSVFASFTLVVAGLIGIMIPLVGGQIREFQKQREEMAANAQAQITPTTEVKDPNASKDKDSFDKVMVHGLIDYRNKNDWAKPFIDPLLAKPTATSEERTAFSDSLDDAQEGKGSLPTIDIEQTKLFSDAKGYFDEVFGWIKGGAGKVLGFLGLALGFLMVPIYLYYILNESAAIKEHWHDYVPLKASRFKTELVETLTEINRYLISFFRGQVLVAFIDGILVGIALTIFGLPLGLLIGILMAVLGIIPYIGNILTLIPACVLAWFHFSVPANQGWLGSNPWTYVGATIAIFVIVQQINSLVTAPKIVGDSVGLHPMTVIFSMLFWSLILGGFVGALLAVPLTAAVKVLFRRYIWERKIKEDEEEKDGYEEWEPSGREA
ncbi:AI-2E family transporter [Haloferula sp. BvORR071]|uniref:AI-2E family transporter n=1 Tax=Haloferula sp. BvORR071 TaxID=1396141 RepID=UPI0006977C9A|nr:AI-2E family transporter [Haloferula sp. BvORR071]